MPVLVNTEGIASYASGISNVVGALEGMDPSAFNALRTAMPGSASSTSEAPDKARTVINSCKTSCTDLQHHIDQSGGAYATNDRNMQGSFGR